MCVCFAIYVYSFYAARVKFELLLLVIFCIYEMFTSEYMSCIKDTVIVKHLKKTDGNVYLLSVKLFWRK